MLNTLDELGAILRSMYDRAPSGQKVANIHLFSIKYAENIQRAGLNARQIVNAAGLRSSYAAEVQKGINLSHYVVPRPRYAD